VHTLKKGILLGLGLHDLNKKQVDDFVDGLYRRGEITRDDAEELSAVILRKARENNEKLELRIENYVRNIVKKEELANIEHVNYLEKRLELLEEELDKALLEKDITNMSDEELEAFLKEIGIKPEDLNGKNKISSKDSESNFENELNKESISDDVVDELLSMSDEDLSKLLREERKVEHGLHKKVNLDDVKSKKSKPAVEVEYFTPKPRKKKAKKVKKSKVEIEVFTPKPRGKSKRKSALAKIKEELKKVKKEVAETGKETKKLKKTAATKDEVKKVKKTAVKAGETAKKNTKTIDQKVKAVKENVAEVKESVEGKVEKVAERVKKKANKPKQLAARKKAVNKPAKKKVTKKK